MVNKISEDYLKVQMRVFERLKQKFENMRDSCLDPDQLKELKDNAEVKALVLPGQESDDVPFPFAESPSKTPASMQPANNQDEEEKQEESCIDAERNGDFSEKKVVAVFPISTLSSKDKFGRQPNKFSDRCDSCDPFVVAKRILQDISKVGLQIEIVWEQILEVVRIEPKYVLELLKHDYENKVREKWGESIFRHIIDASNFAEPSTEDVNEV